jgi:hypothetical protein
VEKAREKLLARIATYDREELRRQGPHPQTLLSWAQRGAGTLVVPLVAALIDLEVLVLTGSRWFLLEGAIWGSVAALARRLGAPLRWWAGWLTGIGAITALLAVAYVAEVVVRLSH